MKRRSRSSSSTLVLLALIAGLLVPGMGASPQEADDPLETRVYRIQFKTVEDIVLLVRHVIGEQGSLTMQPRLKAVTVTDEPQRLDRIGRMIAAFDLPPRHVHMAIQLLMGRRDPDPEERSRGPRAPRIPRMPGIDRDLRHTLGVTQWTDYDLLGSASFTAAEGEESMLSLGEEYRIRLKVDTVNAEQNVTRFEHFALERRRIAPDGKEELRAIWDQVLNLRDNQLYVFGATRLEESRQAIFLSVTAGIVR